MEIKATIDIILEDLAGVRAIIDDLKSYPGVPPLQVELAKAKCRSAEEVIRLLAELDLQYRGVSLHEDTKSEYEIAAVPQAAPAVSSMAGSDIQEPAEPVKEEAEAIERHETPEEYHPKETNDTFELTDTVPDQGTSEAGEPGSAEEAKDAGSGDRKILADKFSHLSSRINEKLGNGRKEEAAGDMAKLKPVSDLKEAIGINDRYFFIRELFNGDQKLFLTTLESMNGASKIEEARSIMIENIKGDPASEAGIQLMDLVKRKLSPR